MNKRILALLLMTLCFSGLTGCGPAGDTMIEIPSNTSASATSSDEPIGQTGIDENDQDTILVKKPVFIESRSNDEYEYDVYDDHIKITKYLGYNTEVVIPEMIDDLPVKNIDRSAFENCTSLTSVDIPNGVTSIGFGTFAQCTSLTSINIPDSVASIGGCAFDGTPWFTALDSEFVIVGDGVLIDYNGSENHVVIPDNVKFISSAFHVCLSLASVDIPNGVTSIGGYAFANCVNLTNVDIPDNVNSIDEYAFFSTGLTSVDIPDSVTDIGHSAFFMCPNLASVDISDNITVIDLTTFGECASLTSISIPEGVTLIGRSAFSGCKNLESVSIPDSVSSIGENAFFNCNSLTINCSAGSYAETYAQENNISCNIQ